VQFTRYQATWARVSSSFAASFAAAKMPSARGRSTSRVARKIASAMRCSRGASASTAATVRRSRSASSPIRAASSAGRDQRERCRRGGIEAEQGRLRRVGLADVEPHVGEHEPRVRGVVALARGEEALELRRGTRRELLHVVEGEATVLRADECVALGVEAGLQFGEATLRAQGGEDREDGDRRVQQSSHGGGRVRAT
jgi:hypothetical protein